MRRRLDHWRGEPSPSSGRAAVMLFLAIGLAAGGARATDGGSSAPPDPPPDGTASATEAPTYYEATLGTASAASLASPTPELPTTLALDDATALASYVPAGESGGRSVWELRIEGFDRRHERVDAIYDMVLVLPLPAGPDGGDAFEALGRGVRVEEGAPDRSVPLVYGGEKIVLKRNIGLEKTFLPGLVGSGAGQLPDLAGSGYRWTAWDTIVRRDDQYGEQVTARAVLRFSAAPGLTAPDASDPRLAAYLITWIPSLPANVAPFAVRLDVAPTPGS